MYGTYLDNRELSWLKFNSRVLEEAVDTTVPLCERLSFTAIFQNNLDEFFMVRVGSLTDQVIINKDVRENKTNMTNEEQLSAIFIKVKELYPKLNEAYNSILKELENYNVKQVNFKSLSKDEEHFLKNYFNTEIKPLVSPHILDKRHPFPFFKNKEIYATATLMSKSGSVKIGIIPASGAFSRLVFLPGISIRFMLVEELILHYMSQVFFDYKISDKSLVRITRNADIDAEEAYDDDIDFRDAMTELLKKRRKLSPVRMEISRKLSQSSIDFLCNKFEITDRQIFSSKAPLDLSFVYQLSDKLKETHSLFFKKLVPQKSEFINPDESMIKQIKRHDILLSYPYESIKPFIRLLEETAEDPYVISVKITLYRVAKISKVVEKLIDMAENGKEVVVLVELRARFDEENNISWSKRLENAGCTVIYGLKNLKVHSKLLLITRKKGNKIEYLTQIGTGNYNEKTATLYTDFSLMTASDEIASDAYNIFNALCMDTVIESTDYLLVAPKCLQNKILEMLDFEISEAEKGLPAYFGAKLNSLTDKIIIEKLVTASQAGVKIELLIRGICCLIPGVSGYTENITVISIVGRYLEHSRIYIFGTPERQKVYISSADFMTRNTLRRVEVAVPLLDTDIKNRVVSFFQILLRDNVKARIELSDGSYVKRHDNATPFNAQEYFFSETYRNAYRIPIIKEQKKPSIFDRLINKLKKNKSAQLR